MEEIEVFQDRVNGLKELERRQHGDNEGQIAQNKEKIESLKEQNRKNNVMLEAFSQGEEGYNKLVDEIEKNKAEISNIEAENVDLINVNMNIRASRENATQRNYIEQLKGEIVEKLRDRQKFLINNRDGEVEIVESEIQENDQDILNKEQQLANKREALGMLQNNEYLASQLEQAKAIKELEEEQRRLTIDIEAGKRGVEIERQVAQDTGYTGTLETKERFLKQRQDKFDNNVESIKAMRSQLQLSENDDISTYIQDKQSKYDSNISKVQQLGQQTDIAALEGETEELTLSYQGAKIKEAELYSKLANYKEIAQIEQSNIAGKDGVFEEIETIASLIKQVESVDTKFELAGNDVDLENISKYFDEVKQRKNNIVIEIEGIKDAKREIESEKISDDEEHIVSDDEKDHKISDDSDKESEIEKLKQEARAKFEAYLESKGIEKEQVPCFNILMQDVIKEIQGRTQVECFDSNNIEDNLLKIVKFHQNILDNKSYREIMNIKEEDIGIYKDRMEKLKQECDILGIKYKTEPEQNPGKKPEQDPSKKTEQNSQQKPSQYNKKAELIGVVIGRGVKIKIKDADGELHEYNALKDDEVFDLEYIRSQYDKDNKERTIEKLNPIYKEGKKKIDPVLLDILYKVDNELGKSYTTEYVYNVIQDKEEQPSFNVEYNLDDLHGNFLRRIIEKISPVVPDFDILKKSIEEYAKDSKNLGEKYSVVGKFRMIDRKPGLFKRIFGAKIKAAEPIEQPGSQQENEKDRDIREEVKFDVSGSVPVHESKEQDVEEREETEIVD